ncbi:acyl-CoA dehydrogenase family protein [Myceligenerans indicum]|uniref:Acyl-CoA dehydrogenase n=1 Tax=Myceligenerans indicum TaxID=2593663 RepID=A0ABS1LMG0_9MICO|nr:acyl-CoA dehydrogenase family protein [Myceligenerans indicum]MBL0887460.1 hypothetical protein [Myceligenerans indicum]
MSAGTDQTWLGDPFDDANPAGFAHAARRRHDGEPPKELVDEARRRGFALAYTPAGWGGALRDPVTAGRQVREVVTRDADAMTALLMHLTPVLLGGLLGTPERRERLVRRVGAGEDLAYALSEREHGADLLSMSTTAQHLGDRVVLSGRKWLVGLAPSASAFVVVARSEGRGPAAFSAYVVPADAPGVRVSAPRPTDGFSGTRFADVEFDQVSLPASALLGPRGGALEAVLRSQTVVRALSLPGALGCADADRMLLARFAAQRRGGAQLGQDPLFRADAGRVAGAMLLAEAAAEAALDALAAAPESAALVSALSKHAVVESVAAAHAVVGRLLASRGVLADGVWGMHAKVAADARVVGTIDGSEVATLRAVAAFLPRCLSDDAGRHAANPGTGTAAAELDPAAIGVAPPTRDPALDRLAALDPSSALSRNAHVTALRSAIETHRQAAAGIGRTPRPMRQAALVEHARRHAWLSSAAGAVVAASSGPTGPLADAVGDGWLDAALDHALGQAEAPRPGHLTDRVAWGAALLDATTAQLDDWTTDAR